MLCIENECVMEKIKKILIAIDDSPISEKVASVGFQLGRQLNAEIALLSVIDNAATYMTDGNVTPREMVNLMKIDYKKNQQLLIEKVFKDFKIWTFIEEGKVYETILKVAEEWESDLIIMGTHGRTGLTHLLMGSVAEKVVRHSTKPLFIVPTK